MADAQTVQTIAPTVVKTMQGRTPAPEIQRVDNGSPIAEALADASTRAERQRANGIALAAMTGDRLTNLAADPYKPTRPAGLDSVRSGQLSTAEAIQWGLDNARIAGAAQAQEIRITSSTTPLQFEAVAEERTRAVEAEKRRTVELRVAETAPKPDMVAKFNIPNEPTDVLNIGGEPTKPGPGAAATLTGTVDAPHVAKASGAAPAIASPAAAAANGIADALFASVAEPIRVGAALVAEKPAGERPFKGLIALTGLETPEFVLTALKPSRLAPAAKDAAFDSVGQSAIGQAPQMLALENKPADTLGAINLRQAQDEPEFASAKPAPQVKKPWFQPAPTMSAGGMR